MRYITIFLDTIRGIWLRQYLLPFSDKYSNQSFSFQSSHRSVWLILLAINTTWDKSVPREREKITTIWIPIIGEVYSVRPSLSGSLIYRPFPEFDLPFPLNPRVQSYLRSTASFRCWGGTMTSFWLPVAWTEFSCPACRTNYRKKKAGKGISALNLVYDVLPKRGWEICFQPSWTQLPTMLDLSWTGVEFTCSKNACSFFQRMFLLVSVWSLRSRSLPCGWGNKANCLHSSWSSTARTQNNAFY